MFVFRGEPRCEMSESETNSQKQAIVNVEASSNGRHYSEL